MRIVFLNSTNFATSMLGETPDVQHIPPMRGNARIKLFEALRSCADATLIIDSELKPSQQSRYQDLEGLKIAYECRTHPEIKYRGSIKLFGFLPTAHVKEHRFGGLLRSGERIHAKEFTLKGAAYFRYPYVDTAEETPLSEDEWRLVVEELDEIFVQEFRRFEHGFRNVIIVRGMDANARKEKKEELESHLKTLAQIEKATVIRQQYRSRFDSIKGNLRSLPDCFAQADESEIGDRLSRVKSEVHDLREELMTVGREK